MSLITLLTDFGNQDEFVGVMKGAILSINPSVTIIDISHHIDPQNVVAAAYMLKSAYPYFPRGTVHVVIVDPGVGSDRKILAASIEGHLFLAPDNGVLSLVAEGPQPESIVEVTNPHFFRSTVSDTFHGRDKFAPAAAHLVSGVPVDRMGPTMSLKKMVFLDLPRPRISGDGTLKGSIVHTDRFGNLITNIDAALIDRFCGFRQKHAIIIEIGGSIINGLSRRYSSVPLRSPVALIGSRGVLEIGVNCGDAASHFRAGFGEKVRLRLF